MFNSKFNKKTLGIIGCWPPPYGGIGVHLQGLVAYLENEGVDFILYNTASTSQKLPNVVSVSRHRIFWYLWFCFFHRHKIVHLLAVNWFVRIMFGIISLLKPGKYILSIHNESISRLLRSGWLRGRLTRWLLRRMDIVIACNSDIEQECVLDVGLSPEKVYMIPGFIPVSRKNRSEIPGYVQSFVKAHKPLLCAVGWIGRTSNGKDLYGIDMLIELVSMLKRDYPEIGLILSINNGQEEKNQETIKTYRRQGGNNMLLITEDLEDIIPLLQYSDLFLRPTNSDGDAVSIREALWIGVPVVASDATPRPEPCVLFRSRDMQDFEKKVRYSLSSLSELKTRVKNYDMPDNAKKILDIYRQLQKGLNDEIK